jgi:hypothetical protein
MQNRKATVSALLDAFNELGPIEKTLNEIGELDISKELAEVRKALQRLILDAQEAPTGRYDARTLQRQ